MTKSEYSAYEAAVQAFFRAEQITHVASITDKPSFSWAACECCKRPEGGMREEVKGVPLDGRSTPLVYEVCEDCIYYIEYGRLDDATMLDIEASAS